MSRSRRQISPAVPRAVAVLVVVVLFAVGCTSDNSVPGAEGASATDTTPSAIADAPTVAATATPSATATHLPEPERPIDVGSPNVLLVILDDVGLDWFPGFAEEEGFSKASMPTIEGLMNEGFVFTNLQTYSQCSPTRASLLTGKHGVETGVLDPGRTSLLDTGFQSIQAELNEQTNDEIATGVFGKWHIAGNGADAALDHPNQFGIDHYAGILRGNHEDYSQWTKVTNGESAASTTYSTTEFTNDAISWISDQDAPWFTWLAYTAPHSPVHLPPSALHNSTELGGSPREIRQNPGPYFAAMLESVDTEVGRLLDSLDATTRANTFVFVIGDNGTGGRVAQEPYAGVGAKGSLQVGGINTPMVAYSPYHKGNGVRYDHLISTIDYFPTILDLFGLQAPDDLRGSSFAPLISGSTAAYVQNDHVFSQNLESVAVRSRTHKLIRFETGEERFYDIVVDPFERSDLVAANSSVTTNAEFARLRELVNRFLDGDYDGRAS